LETFADAAVNFEDIRAQAETWLLLNHKKKAGKPSFPALNSPTGVNPVRS